MQRETGSIVDLTGFAESAGEPTLAAASSHTNSSSSSSRRTGGPAISSVDTDDDEEDDLHACGLHRSSFNSGYYARFFREECKLGSGGVGGVYLTHHVLDNGPQHARLPQIKRAFPSSFLL